MQFPALPGLTMCQIPCRNFGWQSQFFPGFAQGALVVSELVFDFEFGNIDCREIIVESMLQFELRSYGQGCSFAACAIVLAAAVC